MVIDFVNYIGEWWKADVEAVVNQATQTGLPPNISDAHIVNGQTGVMTLLMVLINSYWVIKLPP